MKFVYSCLFIVLVLGFSASAQFVQENLTPNTSLNQPIDLAHAPDGRIFIAERGGAVKVYHEGQVSTVFTVSTNTSTEQGLLGISCHPDFTTEGWLYVFYTEANMSSHRIERHFIEASNQVSATETLLNLDPIQGGFHNGGSILFKDGYMFLSSGDSQTPANSQDLDQYRGKILRLTDLGDPAPGNPYFGSGSLQRQSIWAVGFRNAWRMDVDPQSGRLFVADVGAGNEEVNEVTAPQPDYNYAWGHPQGGDGPRNNAQFIDPIFSYPTGGALGCAITNVTYFNPAISSYPTGISGNLIFKDWCRGDLRYFDPDDGTPTSEILYSGAPNSLLGLSVGIDGNLYYVNFDGVGRLYRLIYENDELPAIVNQPVGGEAMEQGHFSFQVTVSGATPLSFQWYQNGQAIQGANQASLQLTNLSFADSGGYSVEVTNAFGTTSSLPAQLNVLPFNAAPECTIRTPSPSLRVNGLDTVWYSGEALDLEEGAIDATKLEWELQLWHQDTEESGHWHPGVTLANGASGFFVADNQGEKSPNIWFMLILKATDSQGVEGRDTVEIFPNKVTLTAQTQPEGLSILINNSEANSPNVVEGVVGVTGLINAPSPQIIGQSRFEFSHWLHGGEASQEIIVPDENTTYTAVYTEEQLIGTSLCFEAEEGEVVGGFTEESAPEASANGYLFSPNGENSYAEPGSHLVRYKFQMSEPATITMWGRFLTPSDQDDSYFYRLDGGDWIQLNNLVDFAATEYAWVQLYNSLDGGRDNPLTFSLTEGIHVLEFANREDGASMDKLFLSSFGEVPSGIHSCNAIIPISYIVTTALDGGEGTITPPQVEVMHGGFQDFVAVPNPGFVFDHWHASNGLVMNGWQDPEFTLRILAPGELTAHFVADVISTTQSDEVNIGQSVFPNPATEFMELSSPDQWKLIDPEGKVLLTGEGTHIDVRGLPRGSYMLTTSKNTYAVVLN